MRYSKASWDDNRPCVGDSSHRPRFSVFAARSRNVSREGLEVNLSTSALNIVRVVHTRMAGTLALGVALLVALTPPVAIAQEYREIVRLGTGDALCEAIESGQELQAFFRGNADVVRTVLADAAWPGDPDALFEAVAAGEYRETSYPVGTRLMWMGRQVKGQPEAMRHVQWAGSEPFDGFELEVVSGCEVHTVVVPKECCNVSLFAVHDVPAPASPALSVDAQCAGEPVQIVATAPEEVRMSLRGPDGDISPLPLVTEGNRHTWDGLLADSGSYTATATAHDACGVSPVARETFDLPECPVEKAAVAPFIGPFVGWERRTRDLCNCIDDVDAGLVGAIGGVLIPAGEHSRVLLQLGGAANTEDSSWSSLFADVGLNFDVGERGFIGGGVGLWDINRSSMRDTTVFIQGGRDAWDWGTTRVQWFVEGRRFLDRDDVEDIRNNYAVLGGLRMILGGAL